MAEGLLGMAVFWRPPSQGRMSCEPGAPPHQDRALAWAGLVASCENVFPCCRQGPTATAQGCMQASGPVSAARRMAMGMVPTVEADLALSSLRAERSSVSDWLHCFLGNSNTEMQWGSGAQRGLAISQQDPFPRSSTQPTQYQVPDTPSTPHCTAVHLAQTRRSWVGASASRSLLSDCLLV